MSFTRLFLIGIVFPFFAQAQKTVDVEKNEVKAANSNFFFVINGEPFVNVKFTKVVEGTPYFRDDWMKGNVVMNGGQLYMGHYFKLDLLDNELHYKNAKGEEMITTSLVQRLNLLDTIDQRLFTFVHSSFINANKVDKGWYQLLTEGKTAILFKQIIKRLRENKPYGSATVEQYIVTADRYIVLYNEQFIAVRKLKELAEVFADKKDQLIQFISQNNLNGKTDEDFIAVVNFYNSLKQ